MRIRSLLGRVPVVLALVALACNAQSRDSNAVSGSAGLSAGSGSSTSTDAVPTSGDADSTSSAGGTTGGDEPGSTGMVTAAGETGEGTTDAGTAESGTTWIDDSTSGGEESSSGGDSDSSGIVDGVLDIGIIAHNDCTFMVTPSSITVPEGTEFTVNWVSSGASEVEFDIAKIDPFNHVPIVIGMEPGTSYHDDIREWCGTLFTGTFDFRLTSCHDPLYIPVDCGG